MEVEISKLFPIRRRFQRTDDFFIDGNTICYGSNKKQLAVDIDEEEYLHKPVPEFSCHIANCMIKFKTIHEYEWHYNNIHRHVCKDCKKMFPTDYLLERHILETHDELFKLMAEKQPMYNCLVEKCACVFKTPKERKTHLIEDHKYPSNFRFSQLPISKISKTKSNVSEVSNDVGESSMEVTSEIPKELIDKSRFKYAPRVPKTICFGYGTTKGFLPNKEKPKGKKHRNWNERLKPDKMDTSVQIEKMDFADLLDTLPASANTSKKSDLNQN